MASDAGPVKDFPRVEVVALAIFGVARISLGLMACRALLKLGGYGEVLDAVMATDAGDSGWSLVWKARIGIDKSLMLLMIEQDKAAPAAGIEPDRNSSS